MGNQTVSEYTYLYGAFCSETGDGFLLILPYANKDCMNVFLNMLSEKFSDYRMIIAMDNASWYSGKNDIENIVPLFQPPHSPEVNPAGNISGRRGVFKIKLFLHYAMLSKICALLQQNFLMTKQ